MVFIPKKTGKYVQCEYCGKTVYKTLSYYNRNPKHHFCSNKCQALFKRNEVFEYRKCELCGAEFYVSKKSTQRFCSVTCQNEWQRGNTGFNNQKFQGGYLVCDYCGKEYIVGKYKLEKAQKHFCSDSCRQQWYSRIWSQTDEWKEESRKRAVKILSENKIITMTKPQKIANQILDKIGIIYRNEEPFVFYSIDNYLPKHHLAIEVMGDYWHGSPLKYALELNSKQKHIVSRDKAKHTYIKNNYDIEILYLWERDILNNQELCRMLIEEYITSKGNLPNYHSFNYYIDSNGVLSLNNQIIYPHQEKQIAC